MILSGGNLLNPTTAAKVHAWQSIVHLTRLATAWPIVSQSELSETVLTPTLDGAVFKQRARVSKSNRDLHRSNPFP
jgi:hypothetical protein